ncbi:hypothetical protein [Amycolatopsis sp. NPDC004378]
MATDDTAEQALWGTIAMTTIGALDRLTPHPQLPGAFFASRQGTWDALGRHGTAESWATTVVWWALRAAEFAPHPAPLVLAPEEATDNGMAVLDRLWNEWGAGASEVDLAEGLRAQRAEHDEPWAIDVSTGVAYALRVALATCPASHVILVEATDVMRTAAGLVGLGHDVEDSVVKEIVLARCLDEERRKGPLLHLWSLIQAGRLDANELLLGIRALQTFLAQDSAVTIAPDMQMVRLGPDGQPASTARLDEIDPTPTHDDDDMDWTAALGYRLLVAERADDRATTEALLATVTTIPQRLSMLEVLARWAREAVEQRDAEIRVTTAEEALHRRSPFGE